MKKRLKNILFVLVFFIGLSLLLYPYISNEWNTYRQSQLIASYEQVLIEGNEEKTFDYAEERVRAQEYNEALLPYILPDSFAIAAAQDEPDEEYMACLNLTGDGMMGYVEIPKIQIKIPIYHTTSEEVLGKAAGHLEGSSLPIGGENTHAVISAHRGLPSAALFTDLDKMEKGDLFLIYVLDEILCYEVDLISVVDPSDTELLGVVEGEDLITLLTCTPYGVNSHRLLVRGHRVEYEQDVLEKEKQIPREVSIHTNYLLWVVTGLVVTGLIILLLILRELKIHRKEKRKWKRKQ